jgi:hypothetical protein
VQHTGDFWQKVTERTLEKRHYPWRKVMNNQNDKMTRQELLDQIRSERGRLEKTLARLTHAKMLLPGVDGEWSVKDVLAHISTWERWMIRWTNKLLEGEKPDTPDPWDIERMNAETFERVKEIPLAKVLEEFRQSYWDSLTLAESLNETQLQTVYPDTWPMGPLWTGIAANMNWHYKEHRIDVQKWLDNQKKKR